MVEWLSQLADWYGSLSSWELFWLGVGFTGQCLFGSRFLVQWIVSERRGRSVIPVVFWYLSISGSLTLFTYATVFLHDPVFMVGQAGGCFIYVRNLILLEREKPSGTG